MYYRRKILLALLQVFGGKLDKIDFQKYLFLITRAQNKPSYDFVPFKFGCYSFIANADKKTMTLYNLLSKEEDWVKIDKVDYLTQIKQVDKNAILGVKEKFGKLKGNGLLKLVYTIYPYYAINSTILDKIVDVKVAELVKNLIPRQRNFVLFTIGYEGKSLEEYFNQLIKNNIKVLCDVRRNPVSMKYGFSKKTLKLICEKLGIIYMHYPELGINATKRKNLKNKQDYENLFNDYAQNSLPSNKETIGLIFEAFLKYKRVALTCFENEHLMCHRHKIIDEIKKIDGWKFKVTHI